MRVVQGSNVLAAQYTYDEWKVSVSLEKSSVAPGGSQDPEREGGQTKSTGSGCKEGRGWQ